jgi:hypothetical protein
MLGVVAREPIPAAKKVKARKMMTVFGDEGLGMDGGHGLREYV